MRKYYIDKPVNRELLYAACNYFGSLAMLAGMARFVFGYGLYAIISRIPFFRWAVLGISKKKVLKNEK